MRTSFMDCPLILYFQNNDGKVDLDEYTETLRKLSDNNNDEAIKFLFRVYDADGISVNHC